MKLTLFGSLAILACAYVALFGCYLYSEARHNALAVTIAADAGQYKEAKR